MNFDFDYEIYKKIYPPETPRNLGDYTEILKQYDEKIMWFRDRDGDSFIIFRLYGYKNNKYGKHYIAFCHNPLRQTYKEWNLFSRSEYLFETKGISLEKNILFPQFIKNIWREGFSCKNHKNLSVYDYKTFYKNVFYRSIIKFLGGDIETIVSSYL